MSRQYIYTIESLTKKHGPREVLKDIWLSFYPGAKIGVLGRNGSGKSTLMRIMAGTDKDFDGEARLTDGFTRGYLSQEPQLSDGTVWDNLQEAIKPRRSQVDRYNEISMLLAEPMDDDKMQKLCDEMARLQDQIEATGAWELDRELEIAMEVMNLPDKEANAQTLSGGERRRVALCKLLLNKPDMLLLDEPTNHLDAEAVNWLEHHLAEYHGTVVAVTHDRYFLDNVAQWILELDRGMGMPFEGNYTSWLEQKQQRLIREERQSEAKQKTLQPRKLEWIRMSPRPRQAKSKARIAAYEKLSAERFEERSDEFEIQIPPGKHLGDLVVEAVNVNKGYGDNLLVENLNFRLPAGGIVGVIGPNGAGKTTLFRMMMGQEQPDSGELRIGATVEMGYVDQNRDSLAADKTVYEEISGGHDNLEMGGRKINSRAYVNRFNFRGPDQEKKVGNLSGGERNRVHLAKLLRRGSNVLLLDEPTNDLDVDTLRALEEAILNYAGCVVVISHDRWFLDRIATHILAFEGDSYVHWCEGNFQTYEEQRKQRLGIAANQPHRFKYKKLAR